MDILENILFIPFALLMTPIIGLASFAFLNPFSLSFMGFTGLLLLATYVFPKSVQRSAVCGICLGMVLMWLSLMLSYQNIPENFDILNKPIATGGFPLKAFEYPHAPMGNDVPPTEMWPLFYVNFLFWLVVSVPIIIALRKKILTTSFVRTAIVLTAWVSAGGLGYLVLKFD